MCESNPTSTVSPRFERGLLDGRGFEFALERAVFVSVLHRLFVSGSDRSCEKWMVDYAIPRIDDLRLHHLYRVMAWLGEELAPAAEGELAPRRVKDKIEERLFERQRDLFTDLSLVSWTPSPCRSTARGTRAWGRTVNHARPNDVTQGYAADWTIAQLREPAQKIADRIEALARESQTS